MAKDMNGIVGPECYAVGKVTDVSDMKRKIAQIIRRLDLKLGAIDIKEPTKGSQRENGEANSDDPKPDMPIPSGIFCRFCFGLALSLRAF